MHTSQETQMSTQLSEDATQMSQEPTQRSQRERTHARNVVQNKQKLSFVTDNAADIKNMAILFAMMSWLKQYVAA